MASRSVKGVRLEPAGSKGRHWELTLTCGHSYIVHRARQDISGPWLEYGADGWELPFHCRGCEAGKPPGRVL